MSSRVLLAGSGLLVILGLAGVVAGGVFLRALTVAEARLAVTVNANPTPENFADVVEGSTRVVATLVELATFDTFREDVAQSGFDITRELFHGTADEQRRLWNRQIRVERVDDTLVLRVRSRGRTGDAARALTGAVLHALALRAPTIVGNHVVQVHVERMPVLVGIPGRGTVAAFVVFGSGVVLFLLGGVGSLMSFVRRLGARVARPTPPVPPSAPLAVRGPADLPIEGDEAASRRRKASPEDARFWLQKFLEQHQRAPRASQGTIRTWEDLPEARRGIDWLKPPDALV